MWYLPKNYGNMYLCHFTTPPQVDKKYVPVNVSKMSLWCQKVLTGLRYVFTMGVIARYTAVNKVFRVQFLVRSIQKTKVPKFAYTSSYKDAYSLLLDRDNCCVGWRIFVMIILLNNKFSSKTLPAKWNSSKTKLSCFKNRRFFWTINILLLSLQQNPF